MLFCRCPKTNQQKQVSISKQSAKQPSNCQFWQFEGSEIEAYEMSRYIQEISFYQFLIPEYRCLAHPNAQIDNAMFWKNEHGALECGLLDAWQGLLLLRGWQRRE